MRIASSIRAFTRNQNEREIRWREDSRSTIERARERIEMLLFSRGWMHIQSTIRTLTPSLSSKFLFLSFCLFPRIWFRSVLLRHTNTRRPCEYLATHAAFTLPPYLVRTDALLRRPVSRIPDLAISLRYHIALSFLLCFVGEYSL